LRTVNTDSHASLPMLLSCAFLSDIVRLLCCAGLLLALVAPSIGCDKSPAAPSPASATLSIIELVAWVEPLTTTPQPGLLYVLRYRVRESGGQTGAALNTFHFSFSNGGMADGTFTAARVESGATTLGLASTYSVYPASNPAARVEFSIGYTDDRGNSGTVHAAADITRVGL
jgi:hypothetical protein